MRAIVVNLALMFGLFLGVQFVEFAADKVTRSIIRHYVDSTPEFEKVLRSDGAQQGELNGEQKKVFYQGINITRGARNMIAIIKYMSFATLIVLFAFFAVRLNKHSAI